MARSARPIVDRLALHSIPEPNSGCVLWTSALNGAGYGLINVKGRSRLAHRIAYASHFGSIPEGLSLDHLCRVRCCINPAHLEPVTRGENVRRGLPGRITGARNRAKTHCPKGHSYSGDSLRVSVKGSRLCRACIRASAMASYKRRVCR